MSKTKTTPYDVAEHLRTPEEMAAYLEACLEEANGDAAFIAKALGDIARAKGMAQVARDAGLSRESLYKALSGERSPGFDTILKVIGALGLKLHAEAVPVAGNAGVEGDYLALAIFKNGAWSSWIGVRGNSQLNVQYPADYVGVGDGFKYWSDSFCNAVTHLLISKSSAN